MTSLRTQMLSDPVENVAVIHRLIGALEWQLSHAGGYLDRLDAAIELGETLDEGSLEAMHLGLDACTLRELANQMDERRETLIGRAPRLRLIAAE